MDANARVMLNGAFCPPGEQVTEDVNHNVKIKSSNVNKEFSPEEISAQVAKGTCFVLCSLCSSSVSTQFCIYTVLYFCVVGCWPACSSHSTSWIPECCSSILACLAVFKRVQLSRRE